MKKLLLIFGLVCSSLVFASGISGVWRLTTPDGQVITLQLQEGSGQVSGNMQLDGEQFTLQGRSNGSRAEGTWRGNGEEGFFVLSVQGNTLNFAFGDFDENGQADPSTAQEVVFSRVGAAPSTSGTQANPVPKSTNPKPSAPTTSTKPAPVTTPKPSSASITRIAATAKLPAGTSAKTGATYKPGTRVNILNHGLSFVVPNGFSGQTVASTNGNLTIFSQGTTGNIFIWAFTGLEPKDASAWLEYPIDLGQIKLEPNGGVTIQNGALSARHSHPQLESQTSIVFSQKNAIGFTVMTTRAARNQLPNIIKALVSSARFAPSPLEGTVAKLRQGLAGRYLLLYSFNSAGSGTVGGTERQRRWDLCSNGQYAYFGRTESSYSSNNYWAGTNTSFFSTNGANQVGVWRTFAMNDIFSLLTVSSRGELDLHLLSNIQGAGGKLPFLNGQELGAYGRSDKCN
ncbi:MAG: hypothetical protein ACK41E_02955 [Deinococcales bacterium]